MSISIRLNNIKKSYYLGKVSIDVLKDFSLEIPNGITALVGPSGSGKSTLLNILGLIDMPNSGEVFFDNRDMTSLDSTELTTYRRSNIGFIFQSFSLIQSLSVKDNIEYPMLKVVKGSKKRLEMIKNSLEDVGMSEYLNARPNTLSGGQMQRVAIARALVKTPSIILADEPTASLDSANSDKILSLIVDLNKKYNTTVIIATHDTDLLKKIPQRLTIRDGKIIN